MNFAALFMTHKNMNHKVNFCEIKYMLERQLNVHVLEERYSGTLSDWSLIRITMLLIQSAKRYADKKGITFNYYGLFSRQDYQIKLWREFWNAIEQGYPK